MKKFLLAGLLAGLFLAGQASADEDRMLRLFKERFPDVKVLRLKPASVPGNYEVLAPDGVWYVDEELNYIFRRLPTRDTAQPRGAAGPRAEDREARPEMEMEKDMEPAPDKLNALPFYRLPLEMAVKVFKGSGLRQLALFADPDCGDCRKLGRQLDKLNDVTVYVFLLPPDNASPETLRRARQVWCAEDRTQAWADALRREPLAGPDNCNTPLAHIREVASQFGIEATPTLMFADDRRIVGAASADTLEAGLQAARRNLAEAKP